MAKDEAAKHLAPGRKDTVRTSVCRRHHKEGWGALKRRRATEEGVLKVLLEEGWRGARGRSRSVRLEALLPVMAASTGVSRGGEDGVLRKAVCGAPMAAAGKS